MYDAFITEKYKDKNSGEDKARFHAVGVAFDSDKGGIDLVIPPGLSVSGTVYIRERKAKADAGADADDIPH